MKRLIYIAYLTVFFAILTLPLFPNPLPPEFAKTTILYSITPLFVLFSLLLIRFKNNKVIWILTALFISFLLSTIFAYIPFLSLYGQRQRSGGLITLTILIFLSISSGLIVKNWKSVFNFSVVVGTLVSFVAIIQFYNLLPKIFIGYSSRPVATLGSPMYLSIYILTLFFLAIWLFRRERYVLMKIFYSLSLLLFLFIILISATRATYLGLVIGLIYFLFFGFKNKFLIFLILLPVLFSIYYMNFVHVFPEYLYKNELFQMVKQRLSLTALKDARFENWRLDLKIIGQRPLFGWGLENYVIGYEKNLSTDYPFLYQQRTNKLTWDRAHNIIIDLAGQVGILGLSLYLILFSTIFRRFHKRRDYAMSALLLGYFTANLFSFDCLPTYLLFFIIVGYSIFSYENM